MDKTGRIGRNITAQLLSQIGIKLLNIAVSLLLVRWLGPARLGAYAYISAFCYPFGALGDVGLGSLAVREISRDPEVEAETLGAVRRLYGSLALLSTSAMLTVAVLTRHDIRTIAAISLMGCVTLFTSITAPYLVAMTAREDLHRLSLHQSAGGLSGAAITLGILWAGGGVTALFLGAVVSSLLAFFLARALAGNVPRHGDVPWPTCLALLRKAIPFGLVLVGFTVYYRLDMIMLRWYWPAEEVGRYAAAYRFLDAMLVLGAALGAPFYPRLARLTTRDPSAAITVLDTAYRMTLLIGIPLATGATLVADSLTSNLFGTRFLDSANLARLLVWAGLPVLLVAVPSHALNAANRTWLMAYTYWLMVIVNFTANLFLIPRWGAEGACISTIGCNWAILGLVLWGTKKELGALPSTRTAWRYALASAGMAIMLHIAHGWGLGLEILLGVGTYLTGLLFLGYWTSQDFQMLREALAS